MKKEKQLTSIYRDNRNSDWSFFTVLYFVTLFMRYFSSLLHPNHLCCTFIFFELNHVFIQSRVFIWTWKSEIALSYMKSGYALLSFAAFAFCCFLTTASFSPGGHADVNATLTASSMRRTFQSTITHRESDLQVPWPAAVSCPSSNPTARLSLPLLILSPFQTLSAIVGQRVRPEQWC